MRQSLDAKHRDGSAMKRPLIEGHGGPEVGSLELLTESECSARAARGPIEGVGVSVGALPGVFP